MTSTTEVASWYADGSVVDAEDVPAGRALELLAELASGYTELGLLDGPRQPPLWRCCPNAADCWHGAGKPPAEDGRSGLSLPWIGPGYRPGGVAMLGMNLRDAGGLLAEYAITCRSGGDESQLAGLDAGARRINGSPFGYRSTRSAAAVLDYIEGRAVVDHEDPVSLAAVLEHSARLQHVKCSPIDDERSSPTDAMTKNCPPMLLRLELETLAPSVLLTFGDDVRLSLETMPGYTIAGGTDWLSWGQLTLGDARTEVFSPLPPGGAGAVLDRRAGGPGRRAATPLVVQGRLRARARGARQPHGVRTGLGGSR